MDASSWTGRRCSESTASRRKQAEVMQPRGAVVPVAETTDVALPGVEDPLHRSLPVGVHLGGVDADCPQPFHQFALGGLFAVGRRVDAMDDVLVEPCPSRDIVAGEFAPGLFPKLLTSLE
jgi:hypothetical protein